MRSWFSSSSRPCWRRSSSSVGLPARKRRRLREHGSVRRATGDARSRERRPGTCSSTTSAPTDKNWSFNTFYPDQLRGPPRRHHRLHPGAESPGVSHRPLLAVGMSPLEFYSASPAGSYNPTWPAPGSGKARYFGAMSHASPCGHAGQDPACNATIGHGLEFGLTSGVLVNPPPTSGEGNTSFTIVLDPGLAPRPLLRRERCRRIDDERPHRRRTARPADADSRVTWRLPPNVSTRRIWPGSPASIGSAIPLRHRIRTARRRGRPLPA